jgi:hypothetical protein
MKASNGLAFEIATSSNADLFSKIDRILKKL